MRLNRVPGAQSMVSLPNMNAYGLPSTSLRGQSTETRDIYLQRLGDSNIALFVIGTQHEI